MNMPQARRLVGTAGTPSHDLPVVGASLEDAAAIWNQVKIQQKTVENLIFAGGKSIWAWAQPNGSELQDLRPGSLHAISRVVRWNNTFDKQTLLQYTFHFIKQLSPSSSSFWFTPKFYKDAPKARSSSSTVRPCQSVNNEKQSKDSYDSNSFLFSIPPPRGRMKFAGVI